MCWLRFASRKSLKELFVTTNVLHELAFRISTLPFKQPTPFQLSSVRGLWSLSAKSNAATSRRMASDWCCLVQIWEVSSWQVPKIKHLVSLGNSKSLCEKKLHVEPPGKVLHPDVGLMPKTSERTRQGPVLLGSKSPRSTSQTKGHFWYKEDQQEISPTPDSETNPFHWWSRYLWLCENNASLRIPWNHLQWEVLWILSQLALTKCYPLHDPTTTGFQLAPIPKKPEGPFETILNATAR